MSKKKNTEQLPSQETANQFDMLYPMLLADLEEVRELSKKKQDGLLNLLKIKAINKKLEKIKNVVADEPTIEFLDLLDEVTMPSNSDAVFILVQFKTAMRQFQKKFYTKDSSDFEILSEAFSWKTKD